MNIATESLKNNRVNVNGSELVYLYKQLSQSNSKIEFYYNLLKELPEDVFHTIWSTPESYLWSKITWDLVHQKKVESKYLKSLFLNT